MGWNWPFFKSHNINEAEIDVANKIWPNIFKIKKGSFFSIDSQYFHICRSECLNSFTFQKLKSNIYLFYLRVSQVSIPMRSKRELFMIKKKLRRTTTLDSEYINLGLKFKQLSVLEILKLFWTDPKIFNIE